MDTNDILALLKGNTASEELMKTVLLHKSITQSTGIVAYDLQAPSKLLVPVATPLRNVIPRVGGGTGTATNWKVITALTGSGFDAMGWVPEGQRSARMSYTTADKSAAYRTLGEEDSITAEAIRAAGGFENAKAMLVKRLLMKMMLKEEMAILGGNATMALGTTPTPTLSAGGTGATLPGAPTTYSVICVALTLEGYRSCSVAAGITATATITGADGDTFTLSGGAAQKSAAATQAITLGEHLSCSVTPVQGAIAYAWYIGTAGNERLERITTINSTKFSATLAGTGQLASALPSADHSRNSALAFDGLLTAALTSGSGAYIASQATGTAGTGTPLTSSGRGSVSEIDTMLETLWNNYQLSPSVIYVNAQEQKNITNKVLSTGSAPLLQYSTGGKEPLAIVANGTVEYYYNPFSLDGGVKIPIKIHPNLAPGTILAWAEHLPAQYQSGEVPNVAEMRTRADYHQIDWPARSRRDEVGVYADETLAVYMPQAMGVIKNIANG